MTPCWSGRKGSMPILPGNEGISPLWGDEQGRGGPPCHPGLFQKTPCKEFFVFWVDKKPAKKVCSCYNRHEKQKCGSLRMRQHPQACAGAETTYTTAPGWPHRMDIIRRFRSSRKGWICRFLPIPVSHQERSLLASCRTASCTAFLFFTHRPGACPPPGPVW